MLLTRQGGWRAAGRCVALSLFFGFSIIQASDVFAASATYQIKSSPSSYSYFAPPEGPGITGCSPNDYQCDFEMSGHIDFEITSGGELARFTGGKLMATGNEAVFGSMNLDIIAPSSPLLLAEFELISSTENTSIFRDTRFRDVGVNPYTLEVRLNGSDLRLTGGNDHRLVDGDGFRFDLHAFEVPEPSSVAILLVGLICRYSFRKHTY